MLNEILSDNSVVMGRVAESMTPIEVSNIPEQFVSVLMSTE